MTRVPLWALVIGVAAASAALAGLIVPGRGDVVAGVALGTFVAGLFAALAVAVLTWVKKNGGAAQALLGAFVGLMVARMIAYLALLLAAVFMGAGHPVSVGVGLIGGTVVFQVLEIMHLRKMA